MKKDEVKEEPKNQDEHGDLRKEWEEHKANHKKFMENHEQMMKKMDSFLGTKSFKDGGDVKKKDIDDTANLKFGDDDEDNQIKQEIAQSDEMQQPEAQPAQAASTLAPQQAPAPALQNQPMPASDDFQATDFKEPEGVQQEINTPSPMQTFQQNLAAAQGANKDQLMKFQQDLSNGHIQPKTYHDLFADKSTLGKMGTLFGLLVGGAGSGLTHQPNAVLQMMDNQINNDLKAQNESKQNALNFLRVNQADLANKVGSMGTLEGVKTAALANSKAQAFMTTYHQWLKQVDNLPPAQQAKARAVLMSLGPLIDQHVAQFSDIAASALARQGIDPFKFGLTNPNKPQSPQSGQPTGIQVPKNGIGKTATAQRDYPDTPVQNEIHQHVLGPGATDILKRVQYNPQLQPFAGEISSQLADAQKADRAIDEINRIFPKLVHNSDSKTGYLMRKAENLSGTPYIGGMAHGLSQLIGDLGNTQGNRQYNSDYGAIIAQVRAALPGVSGDTLKEIIGPSAPEEGDSAETTETKWSNMIKKLKANVKTDKLDMAGMLNKKRNK